MERGKTGGIPLKGAGVSRGKRGGGGVYLEGGGRIPGKEGLLLILHHLSNDLLLLQPYPGFLPGAHLPQQNPKCIHICSLHSQH